MGPEQIDQRIQNISFRVAVQSGELNEFILGRRAREDCGYYQEADALQDASFESSWVTPDKFVGLATLLSFPLIQFKMEISATCFNAEVQQKPVPQHLEFIREGVTALTTVMEQWNEILEHHGEDRELREVLPILKRGLVAMMSVGHSNLGDIPDELLHQETYDLKHGPLSAYCEALNKFVPLLRANCPD
ncbi:MAG: hypothetical protein KDD70_14270 [Bdellovibrionales bacterium]|nr:hypothetical protein [Bdellovibrionales bacterium]